MSKMWIGVVTLFPEMFFAITKFGVTGRAFKKKILNIEFWNPRNYIFAKNQSVDGKPYGSSFGMLLKAEPLYLAIQAAKLKIGKKSKVIYLTPQGKKFNQKIAFQLFKRKKIILLCGRYAGIDERIIKSEVNEEYSIGDYILSGGELAAMVLIDSISRMFPGVLGCSRSLENESFFNNLLEYPNYTHPRIFRNMKVPDVLLSGNHILIEKWRKKESLERTWKKRPDLLKKMILSKEQKELLKEFQKKNTKKVL